MSLINQMLQDIERRETRPIAMSAQAMGSPHALSAKVWIPQVWTWGLFGFLALTALAALSGGGTVWWLMSKPEVLAKTVIATGLAPVVETSAPLATVASPQESAAPAKAELLTLSSPGTAASAAGVHKQIDPEPLATSKPASSAVRPLAAPVLAKTSGQTGKHVALPRVATATSTRAEEMYQQALAEIKQNQPESALKLLREALEIQPHHVQARLELARILIDRKQTDLAADMLADGLMLLPQQLSFTVALAPLWFQSGRQDEAMTLLAQSARNAENAPDFHAFYASHLLRLKRYLDSAKHYSIALQNNPPMADWLIGLGLSFQGANNNQEALEAFKRAYATGSLTGQKRELVEKMIAGLKAKVGS